MKKVEALLRASQLDVVAEALKKHGVADLIVSEVLSSGPSQVGSYRGVRYAVNYTPGIKLEVVVSDEVVTSTADTIVDAVRTVGFEGATIFVTPVEAVVQIGSREHDPATTWNAGIGSRPLSTGKSEQASSPV